MLGSPWYNFNGWLGTKHQITYLVTNLPCWEVIWITQLKIQDDVIVHTHSHSQEFKPLQLGSW